MDADWCLQSDARLQARVVRGHWITDSVKAGKLLPWGDYAVVRKHQDPKQPRLNFGFHDSVHDSAHTPAQPQQPGSSDRVSARDMEYATARASEQDADSAASTSTAVPGPPTSTAPATRMSRRPLVGGPIGGGGGELGRGSGGGGGGAGEPVVVQLGRRDPVEFIRNYGDKSRLAVMGKVKSKEKREHTKSATANANPAADTQTRGAGAGAVPGGGRVVAHVDMDCFFVFLA